MDKTLIYSNVVLFMPTRISDAIMASPIIADLRKKMPRTQITLVCTKKIAPLFDEDKDSDDVIFYELEALKSKRKEKKKLIINLSEKKFDLGIILSELFLPAYIFFRARIKRRIGFSKDIRNLFLTDNIERLPSWQGFHQTDQYKMLLKSFDIKRSRTKPKITVSSDHIDKARKILKEYNVDQNETLIGIHTSSNYGPTKNWIPERFQEVARKLLLKNNVRVIFFGDEKSVLQVNAICSELPSQVINLANKTRLKELIGIIKLCKVLISNDTGPMHIASAVGTPVVSIFGPTNDLISGPNTHLATVIHKHVECSPCKYRNCPIDFRCMKQITTQEVYEKVIDWLENPERVLCSSYNDLEIL